MYIIRGRGSVNLYKTPRKPPTKKSDMATDSLRPQRRCFLHWTSCQSPSHFTYSIPISFPSI
jgi:hypothetical protein